MYFKYDYVGESGDESMKGEVFFKLEKVCNKDEFWS